jgi:hypothetical protein
MLEWEFHSKIKAVIKAMEGAQAANHDDMR